VEIRLNPENVYALLRAEQWERDVRMAAGE
jgi:hypothetical protein